MPVLQFFLAFFSGPEYGTMEAAWKGALVEAERLCDVHNRVRDDLYNEVIQQVKSWQKDNYHKVINFGGIRKLMPMHALAASASNFVTIPDRVSFMICFLSRPVEHPSSRLK